MAGGSSAGRSPLASLAAKSVTIKLLIWLAVGCSKATTIANSSSQQEVVALAAADGPQQTSSVMQLGHLADRTKRLTPRSKSLGQLAKGPPEFAGPIGNVSAVLGRDIRLVCTVDNLGQHQVAWLKEETKTILSIDTNIIITNYRIFLIPDDEGRKWVLHIKDVRESDRGSYQCQVNTNPTRAISGYLDVVVPPNLIESESTQVAEVLEHSNVSLQCKASGHPRPSVGWHREDGEPIRLTGGVGLALKSDRTTRLIADSSSDSINASGSFGKWSQRFGKNATAVDQRPTITHLNDVRSDRLSLTNVDRTMAGLYVCTASNGIPSPASKQIPLYVKFAPNVSIPHKSVSVHLNEQLDIDCLIEAFPKPTCYWAERQFLDSTSSLASSAKFLAARNNNNDYDEVHIGRRADSDPRLQWFSSPKSSWPKERRFLSTRGAEPMGSGLGAGDQRSQSQLARPIRRHVNGYSNEWLASRKEIEGEDESGDELVNISDKSDDELLASEIQNSFPTTTSPLDTANATKESVGQKVGNLNKAYVTIKQTALNQYTYKLRMSIARMRPNDFGEYVCISSNSLGTSSARILVKKAERNQRPAAEAVESSLDKSLSLSEAIDNQVGYQRDDMSTNGPAQAIWNSNQFIQAQNMHRPQNADSRPSAGSPFTSRHPTRVYDENYLQSIRNRQSSNGYIVASSAFGSERNSASLTPLGRLSPAGIITLLLISWKILSIELLRQTMGQFELLMR